MANKAKSKLSEQLRLDHAHCGNSTVWHNVLVASSPSINCFLVSTSLERRNKSTELNFLLRVQLVYLCFHALNLKLHSGACCINNHSIQSINQSINQFLGWP